MATPRPSVATPYAVVVRFMPLTGGHTDAVCYYRKKLDLAIRECRQATRDWALIVGAQYPYLGWLVIDTRTGEHHHATQITRGGSRNGESHNQPDTLV